MTLEDSRRTPRRSDTPGTGTCVGWSDDMAHRPPVRAQRSGVRSCIRNGRMPDLDTILLKTTYARTSISSFVTEDDDLAATSSPLAHPALPSGALTAPRCTGAPVVWSFQNRLERQALVVWNKISLSVARNSNPPPQVDRNFLMRNLHLHLPLFFSSVAHRSM
ncbi:hypothetical protein EDD15DRAFT_1186854 [Pisolithus albus]|nr:hypothetical protein EDD15DRAFT_1186854 [Pisolithus albus]